MIHPEIWENEPALGYWLAKPVWVAIPMALVAWWLLEDGVGSVRALLAGMLAGIISLQAYYTLLPVPIEGGPAIQVGFLGNFTEGLIVHFGGLAIAGVLVLLWFRRGELVRE